MLKVKLNQGNMTVSMPFVSPILQFQPVIPQFFGLIHGALVPDFPVAAAELSGGAGFKLNEVFAKFNLYGGPNAVTLYSDRLLFEFVNLIETDYPVVYDLMRRVHDAFPNTFPSTDFDKVETFSAIHFEADPPGDVTEYLERFRSALPPSAFAGLGEHVAKPIARYNVIGVDQRWRCRFGVEKSELLANGIFVDLNMVLRMQSKDIPFVEKRALASSIGRAVADALELDYNTWNAPTR